MILNPLLTFSVLLFVIINDIRFDVFSQVQFPRSHGECRCKIYFHDHQTVCIAQTYKYPNVCFLISLIYEIVLFAVICMGSGLQIMRGARRCWRFSRKLLKEPNMLILMHLIAPQPICLRYVFIK